MKSFLGILILFSLCAAAFAFPLQIKDSTGQAHYFIAAPKRIVSTIPSVTEMLFALGLDNEIKGVTLNCNYPPGAKKKVKIGREIINIEAVVALHPHLIVMLEEAQKVDIQRLRKLGLPVFTINPHSVSDVLDDLILLGKITSREAQARKTVFKMKERLKNIPRKKNLPPPKVLVVVGMKPLIVSGPGTFIADILKTAGARNFAQKARAAYPVYSMEELILKQPEAIIVPQNLVKDPAEIYNDLKWRRLAAVQDKKILFIDADIISRPGPRVVEAVEKIADFVYNLE